MEIITLKGARWRSGVPEVIRILPLGHVTSQKGEFDVDEESLRLMKAEIARHGVDVVVDYEHQTLDGVQAPAAGWVKDLSIQDGHIVAKVEWTDRAAAYLKNREYRYLSRSSPSARRTTRRRACTRWPSPTPRNRPHGPHCQFQHLQ
ncbi:MAG: phage protease [Dysosmobacter welbionis]